MVLGVFFVLGVQKERMQVTNVVWDKIHH
jgi:hypothetical protein